MILRKTDSATANLTFSIFFCSILGWGVFEILLFQQGGEVRLHLMVTLIGGIISALALRRCRTWWPGFGSSGSDTPVRSSGYGSGNVLPCLALAGIGGLWGLAIKSGSCFFFVLCVAGLIFFPWSRISLCLRHFFISSGVLVVGAGGALVSGGALVHGDNLVDLVPYMFDAWALWLTAVCLVLATYRRPAATMAEEAGKVRSQSSKDAIAHH